MTQPQRIAVCILRYLKSELTNTQITEESRESLEVAIQCLESVYSLSADDVSALAVSTSLPEMFKKCTIQEQTCFKPTQAKQSKEVNQKAEEAKAKGNDALKAEKYLEAIEHYTQAIDLDRENAVYFCNRAAAFSKLDKNREAVEDCEAALAIDPSYSKAYGRMGFAYASSGNHQKALESYQKALNLDPENQSYQNNLRVAREQLDASGGGGTAPFNGAPGGLGGDMTAGFSDFLRNPALMNMASQIMQNPNMQNMMSNLMSGTLNAGQTPAAAQPGEEGARTEGFNMESLLRAGQQFAQHMQDNNAPLIDQLRREMESRGVNPPNNNSSGGNNNANNP